MLSGRDKAKLQAKGFRIFYLVLHERCIKEQVNGSYRVHSRHNNNKAKGREASHLSACLWRGR